MIFRTMIEIRLNTRAAVVHHKSWANQLLRKGVRISGSGMKNTIAVHTPYMRIAPAANLKTRYSQYFIPVLDYS
jgi:hypothetical protein